jgi:hypothetical protein
VAIDYYLDLYPADDPRDGTRLARYTAADALQAFDYRDVIGVGSGRAVMRSDYADDIDPAGEQYGRIVRDDGSTELVVAGLWVDRMRYEAAVTHETRRLTLEGAGQLAYLARAVMAPHTYLDIAIGQDPFDRIWRLSEQGPIAGGDFLGAVLWRVIYEAQHFRVALTEHRHADGLIYTDSHADDRLRSAIPDVVLGFDAFEDSDGNAWTMPAGSFTAGVGENVLQVVRRLIEAGLYVELDPDTFELRAWEGSAHRRDRTGGAWGAAVVRLQAPTDGTIATGNIKSDAERLVTAHIKRTTVWAGGGDDVYGIADTPTGIPWEGFIPSDMADAAALDNLADTQLTARDEAGDVLTARLKLGADPTAGRYLPWEHVKLDDVVTVHTGSGEWDYNEAEYPVGALRIHLREAGDWDAWVDLGASFEAMAQRQFEVAAAPAHTHPLPFCPAEQPALEASCALNPSLMGERATPNGDFELGNTSDWSGAILAAGGADGGSWFSAVNTLSPLWRYDGWVGDLFEAGTTYVFRMKIAGSGAYRVRVGDVADDGSSASGDYSEDIGSGPTLGSGDFTTVCLEWTPSADRSAVKLVHDKNGAHGELGIDSLQAYSGGVPQNVGNGISNLIARCDHTHPGDDIDHGTLDGLGDDDHPQYQTEAEVDAQIAAAVATLEAGDLATRWSPVTTWDGDHWIIVTDGSGTPVLTEVS